MVLAVVGEFSAASVEYQCEFPAHRILSTRIGNNVDDNGTSDRGQNSSRGNHSHHNGRKNCRKFSDVLNSESAQWKLNQCHSKCVVKLLRKLSEFHGHLIKMRLQWFLFCLFLFCTHSTTLARPNANNDLHETNLAADEVNFESNVSPHNVFYSLTNFLCSKQQKYICAEKDNNWNAIDLESSHCQMLCQFRLDVVRTCVVSLFLLIRAAPI